MVSNNIFEGLDINEQILTLQDLVPKLKEVIDNLRTEDTLYPKLKQQIQLLQQCIMGKTWKTAIKGENNNVVNIYNNYQTIINTSLQLRQTLLSLGIKLSQYDHITYAIYYKGKRYYVDKLQDGEYFVSGGKTAALRINLEKIAQRMEAEVKDDAERKLRAAISDAFNQHYKFYFQAIVGMYAKQNKRRLGAKDARVNAGHVAEAYERHLQHEHTIFYKLAQNPSVNQADVLSQHIKELQQSLTSWREHETPDSAWFHIRESLGFQRGTVAGDVGQVQVKQGRSRISLNSKTGKLTTTTTKTLQLSSFSNLRTGLKFFGAMLDPDIPTERVALAVAIYMVDGQDKPTRKILKDLSQNVLNKDINLSTFPPIQISI